MSDCTSAGSPSRTTGVAAHRDARGERLLDKVEQARRPAPTTSAMFTVWGAVSVICVESVMPASIARPFAVSPRTRRART